jgi:glutamine synthetase adenylyltransferase
VATVAETLRAIALADEPPDAEAMRAMREKMVRELYRPDEYRRDLKQMPGGLVELAFTVQYAQMKAQIAETHTGRAIDALVPKGLTAEDAAILRRGLLRFGRAERAFRLLSGDSASVIDLRAPIAAHVARLLGYRASGSTVVDDFRHDLDATAAAVHEVFERVLRSGVSPGGDVRPG